MRERILLDCAESEIDRYLRSRPVIEADELKPSATTPYMEAEPLAVDATTKKVDRDDTGIGDYPVVVNYDPPGLVENQTINKTTTVEGDFYAWIHPDCFDQDTDAPAAGDDLMCGPIKDGAGAARAYNGFRKLGTDGGAPITGQLYCVGTFLYTESRGGVDYRYCRLQLPGDRVNL